MRRVAVRHDGGGRVRRFPGAHKARGDLIETAEPHQEHERAVQRGERLQRFGRAAVGRVAGDDVETAAEFPVCDGDSRRGRNGDARRDAGHGFAAHARFAQREKFLSAAAEHERVAALEPHDALALEPEAHEQRVRLVLRHGVAAAALADRILFRAVRQREERGVEQVVVHDGVALLEQRAPALRDPLRAAAARADEVNASFAVHSVASFAARHTARNSSSVSGRCRSMHASNST